ncbi:MAG: ASCH domain-containing protein [Planctomycetota bacterium]
MIRRFYALSVKQPWANMIASGEKTIETRTWYAPCRGELLIVSSKKPRIEPIGCAVALVKLVHCRPMTEADEEAACCELYHKAIAWELEDLRPLRPFPVTGQPGIYTVAVDEELIVDLPLGLRPLPGQLALFPDEGASYR